LALMLGFCDAGPQLRRDPAWARPGRALDDYAQVPGDKQLRPLSATLNALSDLRPCWSRGRLAAEHVYGGVGCRWVRCPALGDLRECPLAPGDTEPAACLRPSRASDCRARDQTPPRSSRSRRWTTGRGSS